MNRAQLLHIQRIRYRRKSTTPEMRRRINAVISRIMALAAQMPREPVAPLSRERKTRSQFQSRK